MRKTEYQAKVTDENGLTRSRVPCPLLTAMKARPGDHLIFRLDAGKVTIRLSRSRKKSGKKRR